MLVDPKVAIYGIDDAPPCKTLVFRVLLRATDSPTRVPITIAA